LAIPLIRKKNLFEDSSSGNLSSVFNSKKAVHCQIDTILWNLGFSNYSRMKFPQKLNILRDCSVIAPNILTKLNHMRNLLEHEYKKIEKDKAQDLYDLALLFINATEDYCLAAEFITEKYYSDDSNGGAREVEIYEGRDKKKVKLHLPRGSIKIERKEQKVIVKYEYAYKKKLMTLEKEIFKKNYNEYCKWISILMRYKKIWLV